MARQLAAIALGGLLAACGSDYAPEPVPGWDAGALPCDRACVCHEYAMQFEDGAVGAVGEAYEACLADAGETPDIGHIRTARQGQLNAPNPPGYHE